MVVVTTVSGIANIGQSRITALENVAVRAEAVKSLNMPEIAYGQISACPRRKRALHVVHEQRTVEHIERVASGSLAMINLPITS